MSAFWSSENTPWDCSECEEKGMTKILAKLHIDTTGHVVFRDTNK